MRQSHHKSPRRRSLSGRARIGREPAEPRRSGDVPWASSARRQIKVDMFWVWTCRALDGDIGRTGNAVVADGREGPEKREEGGRVMWVAVLVGLRLKTRT